MFICRIQIRNVYLDKPAGRQADASAHAEDVCLYLCVLFVIVIWLCCVCSICFTGARRGCRAAGGGEGRGRGARPREMSCALDWIGPDWTGPDWTGPDWTGLWTGPDRTRPDRTPGARDARVGRDRPSATRPRIGYANRRCSDAL